MAQSVSVVNVNRSDGRWYRYVNSLDNDNVWNRDDRLVLSISQLSPASYLWHGSFGFTEIFPSDEHFARLDEMLGDVRVLRIGQHLHLPSDNEEELRQVEARDHLLHHALYRQLYPFFDRTFIADSFSCRKGKGTHVAMARFRQFAYKVSQNNTHTSLVLKCDIRKIFASIDQEILLTIRRKSPSGRSLQVLIFSAGCIFLITAYCARRRSGGWCGIWRRMRLMREKSRTRGC